MVQANEQEARLYQRLVRQSRPSRPVWRNALWAFIVGGIITTIGQIVMQWIISQGMSLKDAAGPTAAVMIFLGALLTGLGVYDRLGNFGGMGAALPITGFANSMVAPAMEYRREGWILGVGARMFTIAGPVIVYGIIVATVVAVVLFLLR